MPHSKKPLVVVLSTAFALAGTNAFAAQDLSRGYMVASAADTKAAEHNCGEGKCGAAMKPKGKAAEDKTGKATKAAEHKCGVDAKTGEHKCGAEMPATAAPAAPK